MTAHDKPSPAEYLILKVWVREHQRLRDSGTKGDWLAVKVRILVSRLTGVSEERAIEIYERWRTYAKVMAHHG